MKTATVHFLVSSICVLVLLVAVPATAGLLTSTAGLSNPEFETNGGSGYNTATPGWSQYNYMSDNSGSGFAGCGIWYYPAMGSDQSGRLL